MSGLVKLQAEKVLTNFEKVFFLLLKNRVFEKVFFFEKVIFRVIFSSRTAGCSPPPS